MNDEILGNLNLDTNYNSHLKNNICIYTKRLIGSTYQKFHCVACCWILKIELIVVMSWWRAFIRWVLKKKQSCCCSSRMPIYSQQIAVVEAHVFKNHSRAPIFSKKFRTKPLYHQKIFDEKFPTRLYLRQHTSIISNCVSGKKKS